MVYGIILIGGVGSRFNKTTPKQFITLKDKPLFLYSVISFENNPLIDRILIVCLKQYIPYVKKLTKGFSKIIDVIPNGESRQLSSLNGLRYLYSLSINEDDKILIHDGARPLINSKLIDDIILNLNENDIVRPIVEKDDISYSDGSLNINIDNINYLVQTPQGFIFKNIYDAHLHLLKLGHKDFKDDVSVLEYFGFVPKNILGDKNNIKITTQRELNKCLNLIKK